MATTTNYGWTTPNDTDLVRDGASAIRSLGSAIDTTVFNNANAAVQKTLVDAKGDLVTATAADTPARLAVGNNGETLVADSSATTGLRWQGNFAAGKNKIINGDFGIWQRGTSFTSLAFPTYYADRWCGGTNASGATRTVSQQAFTPGTAPVAGYEGTYFLRVNTSVAGTGTSYDVIDQRIENVQTFANQTITVSFWAKAAASTTLGNLQLTQNFGSGGSSDVSTTAAIGTITTSWVRYSYTLTLPSIAGKTIGTGNYLLLRLNLPTSGTYTIDIWGVQIEAGSVATAFQTATGTLAGELAACQRYYFRASFSGNNTPVNCVGGALTTTIVDVQYQLPVVMRTTAGSLEIGDLKVINYGNNTEYFNGTFTLAQGGNYTVALRYTHGSAVFTAGQVVGYRATGSTAYVGLSAEL